MYLYDQLGRIAATFYNVEVRSGQKYYVPPTRANLADGIYFCRLIVNGKVRNRRITLMR